MFDLDFNINKSLLINQSFWYPHVYSVFDASLNYILEYFIVGLVFYYIHIDVIVNCKKIHHSFHITLWVSFFFSKIFFMGHLKCLFIIIKLQNNHAFCNEVTFLFSEFILTVISLFKYKPYLPDFLFLYYVIIAFLFMHIHIQNM